MMDGPRSSTRQILSRPTGFGLRIPRKLRLFIGVHDKGRGLICIRRICFYRDLKAPSCPHLFGRSEMTRSNFGLPFATGLLEAVTIRSRPFICGRAEGISNRSAHAQVTSQAYSIVASHDRSRRETITLCATEICGITRTGVSYR